MHLLARRLAVRLAAALLPVCPTAELACQQLALRTFTARDGLAHGRVNCVYQDRRGYLWFGTWEGLSRFDGQHFVNYGVADGLSCPYVDCITEDASGALWVGTLGGGVARMRERRAASGQVFDSWRIAATPRADDVTALRFDAQGQLWIGTVIGIYRAEVDAMGVAITAALPLDHYDVIGTAGANGEPVFYARGVRAAVRGGVLAPAPLPLAPGGGSIVEVLRQGGQRLALRERELLAGPADAEVMTMQPLPLPRLPGEQFTAMVAGRGATLWIGGTHGVLVRRQGEWQRYRVPQGLPDDQVRCLYLDRDQNLWIGTHRGGLARLADRAVVSYGAREGFADANVTRVLETASGQLFASTDTGGIYEVLPDRVVRLPGTVDAAFAHVHMRLCCDRRGDFWLGSDEALWFCEGPVLAPERGRRVADGLPEGGVCAEIHEGPDGALWFGAMDGRVYRRAAGAARWQVAVALPALGDPSACRVMLDEPDGSVLLASFDHLWRLAGASCTRVVLADGELLRPRCLFRDRRGWTWIGTRYLGVFVQRPAGDGGLLHLTSRDGLASDAVWSVAEDARGRMFLGTAHGISCFDAGALRPFGGNDGLAGEVVNDLRCDRRGRLWVSTSAGLSRFDLDAATPEPAPPPIYLTRVQVDGERLSLPENGSTRLGDVVLAPGRRHLGVEFTGIDLCCARPLRYQHRLLGIDADWSPASESGMVQFADLAAGSYRFEVRAVDADDRHSDAAAELWFTVLPPFWQRAPFLAAMTAVLAALAMAVHRIRLRRAVATERLRTQIATDLHDEVGAGLVQIAILSEVARQRAGPLLAQSLGEVAALARTLREAMSDIVWALGQGHDSLADLVQRMRALGSRMIEVDGTQWDFRAPPAAELDAVTLSIEQRRQLWLWYKEALTNVARHAAADAVDVALAVVGDRLHLSVRDDGAGFEPAGTSGGNGLRSLQRRSQQLGGRMRLQSRPGAGTELALEVPLRPA